MAPRFSLRFLLSILTIFLFLSPILTQAPANSHRQAGSAPALSPDVKHAMAKLAADKRHYEAQQVRLQNDKTRESEQTPRQVGFFFSFWSGAKALMEYVGSHLWRATKAVIRWVKQHPFLTLAILSPILLHVAVAAAGFGTGGVVAGSLAAAWHAKIGSVAAGSIFAALQSMGATTTLAVLGVQTLEMLGAVVIGKLGQLLWEYVFGGMSMMEAARAVQNWAWGIKETKDLVVYAPEYQ